MPLGRDPKEVRDTLRDVLNLLSNDISVRLSEEYRIELSVSVAVARQIVLSLQITDPPINDKGERVRAC